MKITCFLTDAHVTPATTAATRKMVGLDSGATRRMLICVGKNATCLLAVSRAIDCLWRIVAAGRCNFYPAFSLFLKFYVNVVSADCSHWMYFAVKNLFVTVLICHLKLLDHYGCDITTIFTPGTVKATAMFASGQFIVYSRHTLFRYRRSVTVLKSTFIHRLAECGLLRFRGSRAGQATRAHRAARLIPKLRLINSTAELPGVNLAVISR